MIRLRGVGRTYLTPSGAVEAVRDLDLDVPTGSFTTLLGPSGCGKTTTLRIVAGLERPDRGTVVVGGRTVHAPEMGVDVPAYERDLGMVVQSFAVWPHLSVLANVAYPLRARRVGRVEAGRRAEEALAMVGLGGSGRRRPAELSGGQQQRVALARALVARPSVLLLDEPLSNLDARLREEIRGQILDLRAELDITVLFVTHDRDEALGMSDEVVVLAAGRRVGAGRPETLHRRPPSGMVARLLGHPNVLDGVVVDVLRPDVVEVRTALGMVETSRDATVGPAAADPCSVVVPPHALRLVGSDDAVASATARVVRVEFRGEGSEAVLDVGGVRLRSRLPEGVEGPDPGSTVGLVVDPAACRAVPE